MENKTRIRFAPSPTGFLHIGSLRMVIFGYLSAKAVNGKFILRIEDTDQKRKVEGSEKKLIDILNWVGIKFDEGPGIIKNQKEDVGDYGPYVQTERLDIYKKYADKLLKEKKAYRCFCSSERLTKMRENQQAQKLAPRYDRACRDLSEDEIKKLLDQGKPFVIRQKMPLEGEITVKDELRGEIKFKAKDLEDHVLIKSSGIPTYQFAVVIDDHKMEISHVLRGEEWIPSLPKNILLYKDFGWEAPKFIHMSLSLNKEGGKLSKRQGDVSVESYKENGYLKEALINFSIMQGWSPYDKNKNKDNSGKNIEILSLEDALKIFNYKDISISPAVFDIEKLDYFNGYYIRQKELDELKDLCMPFLEEYWRDKGGFKNPLQVSIKNVISLEQERLKKLSEIGELSDFFFREEIEYESDLLVWKKLEKEIIKNNLSELLEEVEKIAEENWEKDKIEELIIKFLKDNNKGIGDYLWPMRVSLSGKKASPGPFEIAWVLGRTNTVNRIKKAIRML
jgi:glutamyl-tRNA synthetase